MIRRINYDILRKCLDGVIVDDIENKSEIYRMASVGFINLGTDEMDFKDNVIRLFETAKTSGLGFAVYRSEYPLESMCYSVNKTVNNTIERIFHSHRMPLLLYSESKY